MTDMLHNASAESSMRRLRSCLWPCGLALLIILPVPLRAATPDQVDASVKAGVDWLYAQQHNGNWEQSPAPQGATNVATGGQWGGYTAIATLTLLAAGESPNDPRLSAAIDFLKHTDFKGNYTVNFRCERLK